MAFSPETGLAYIPIRDDDTFLHRPDPAWRPNDTLWNAGVDRAYAGPLVAEWRALPPAQGRLVAWDPVKQEARWQVDHPVVESGGVLATAGNLVFQGRADGIFAAYRASDGEELWEFDAGTGIMGAPVAYLLDGVQHITVMVGWGGAPGLSNPSRRGPVKPGFGRIVTFAIGGGAKLNVPPFRDTAPPKPSFQVDATPEIIENGRRLYGTYCNGCHGRNAVAGALADLRYSTTAIHEQFGAIVVGNAREDLGMPSFGDVLTEEQAKAIQAYVLFRAAESANSASN